MVQSEKGRSIEPSWRERAEVRCGAIPVPRRGWRRLSGGTRHASQAGHKAFHRLGNAPAASNPSRAANSGQNSHSRADGVHRLFDVRGIGTEERSHPTTLLTCSCQNRKAEVACDVTGMRKLKARQRARLLICGYAVIRPESGLQACPSFSQCFRWFSRGLVLAHRDRRTRAVIAHESAFLYTRN
jgi:hypothetical protein